MFDPAMHFTENEITGQNLGKTHFLAEMRELGPNGLDSSDGLNRLVYSSGRVRIAVM